MFRDDWSTAERHNERKEREASLRRQSLKHSWPTLLLIPVLIAVMHAAAFSLLIELFLSESFGLSGGHPAPWAGAIAVIFLISFWCNRAIARLPLGLYASQGVTLVCWLVTWLAWVLLEPAWRNTTIWKNPGELVQSEAYLIVPLLISMAVWWVGLSYATGIASVSAEDVRSSVQRDWMVLVGSILLAALVGGDAGRDALSQARIAVPLLLIVSLALVAGAEVESTRRVAVRRGAQPPSWSRWARLVSGLSLGVLVLTVLVLAILSPGALDAIVGGIAFTLRLLGTVVGYVLLAIVWTLFQVVILLTRAFNALFGDVFAPIEPPETPMQGMMGVDMLAPEEGETQVWEYAVLLRWVALIIVVAIVAFVLFRITRRPSVEDEDDGVDEQRDSVFSADLARQQLRDLFRRRQRERRPRRLNLDQPPATVRETMRYLDVLATRQGAGRLPEETPDDFAARLRAIWPGTSAPLIDLPRRYERIRYGEQPDQPGSPDHEAAVRAWTDIWRRRKDANPAAPPRPPNDT